jgi:glycosyltransferase involved in cell wall biosynthesis
MKVLFVTNGDESDPSSRVRVVQFLPTLRSRLGNVRYLSIVAPRHLEVRLRKLRVLIAAFFADAVVIQKIADARFVRILKKINRRLFWDIDDGVCLHYPQMNAVLPLFECVVCGNHVLKAHVESFGGRATIIPSVVDEVRFPLDHHPSMDLSKRTIVIGWIGHGSNVHYLESLRQVFDSLHQRFGNQVCLKVVSDRGLDWGPHVINKTWKLDEECSDVRSFDIGVMPLEDDDWSRQKCGYKALLYMSQQVPAVISPVGMNAQLFVDGIDGFHASTPSEWTEKLSRLIEDASLRHRMGSAALETVRRAFTVAAAAPLWQEVLAKNQSNPQAI